MGRYNIGAYEKVYGLYMIFSVKNNRIHCFKEGNTKEEFLLRDENLDRYMDHLDKSILELENINELFNGNDYKLLSDLKSIDYIRSV